VALWAGADTADEYSPLLGRKNVMRTWAFVAALLISGWAVVATAAPVRDPKPEVTEAGAVQIDFSPLGIPGNDCTLAVVIETKKGDRFKDTYTIGAGTSAGTVRDLVRASMPKGWDTKAMDDDKLVIEGYNSSPVAKMEVKLIGLPKDRTPQVQQVGKPR
jgi:hypothetical protein